MTQTKRIQMKLTKFANLIVIATCLAIASGCRSKQPGRVTPLTGSGSGGIDDPGAASPIGDPYGTNGTGITSEPIPQASWDDVKDWPQNREILKAETVYFDYDSSAVRSSERSKVAAVADYLKTNPSQKLLIEGHCDERGTDEYNRALGERRALAVREVLVGLGTDANRVHTISYGRNRLADTGRSEAAHRKNRRDEFVVLTPPAAP